MESSALLLPTCGLLAGIILGYVARRNYFCTLSSLEQHWYAGNSTGLRIWVLAAVSAAVFTQVLIGFGLFDPVSSFYLGANFGWLGALVGGTAFGFGMAMVGTCGYGALVRLGGGSLKSLVAVMVLGLSALSAQYGVLALTRIGFFDYFIMNFETAGDQSFPTLLSWVLGGDFRLSATLLYIGLPALWVFKSRDFCRDIGSIATGLIVGLVIAFGWATTTYLSERSFEVVQIESASFVAPVSDTIRMFTAITGLFPDYGAGMVIGVVIGAAIAARIADDVRWEACDDARELSRHILGAMMMGFGGILAVGCTIGQGVSAASLLASSVPITIISIGFGARLGLAWLLEGSLTAPFKKQA